MCMMPTSTNSHDSDRQPSSISVALGRFDRPEAGLAGASTSWLTAMTRVPRGLCRAARELLLQHFHSPTEIQLNATLQYVHIGHSRPPTCTGRAMECDGLCVV